MAAPTHAEETAVEPGIDLGTLRAFVEHVAEHPDEATSEWRATGFGQRTAGQTLVKVGPFTAGGREVDRENREYTLSMGMPEEVGESLGFLGPTDRMKSTEVALAALAGCVTSSVTLGALAADLGVDDVRTTVGVAYDPRVPLGVHDLDAAGSIYGGLSVDVEVEGEALGEEEYALVEELVRRSPVYNLLTLANGCETEIGSKEH